MPCSTICPDFITRIQSASRIVDNLWATTKVVRPLWGGAKRYSDIWRFARVESNTAIHQNQKPLDLLYRIIKQHTKEGDLILDPFAGSQSLRIACHKLKRNYVGFELDKDYWEQGTKWFNEVSAQMSIFDL